MRIPNPMMMMNIFRNTRNMWLLANAIGKIPRNVVAAPTKTEGPISLSPSAILACFGVPECCRGKQTGHGSLSAAKNMSNVWGYGICSHVGARVCPKHSRNISIEFLSSFPHGLWCGEKKTSVLPGADSSGRCAPYSPPPTQQP